MRVCVCKTTSGLSILYFKPMKNFILIILVSQLFVLTKSQSIDEPIYYYEVKYNVQPLKQVPNISESSLTIGKFFSEYHILQEPVTVNKNGIKYEFGYLQYNVQYNSNSNEMIGQRIYENGSKKYAVWQPNWNWEITDETSEVLGYKVKKAIANSIDIDPSSPVYRGKVYAWFAPDIAVSSGPAFFCGLPGLILKVNYERTSRTITATSLRKKTNKPKFNYIKEGDKVSNKNEIIRY